MPVGEGPGPHSLLHLRTLYWFRLQEPAGEQDRQLLPSSTPTFRRGVVQRCAEPRRQAEIPCPSPPSSLLWACGFGRGWGSNSTSPGQGLVASRLLQGQERTGCASGSANRDSAEVRLGLGCRTPRNFVISKMGRLLNEFYVGPNTKAKFLSPLKGCRNLGNLGVKKQFKIMLKKLENAFLIANLKAFLPRAARPIQPWACGTFAANWASKDGHHYHSVGASITSSGQLGGRGKRFSSCKTRTSRATVICPCVGPIIFKNSCEKSQSQLRIVLPCANPGCFNLTFRWHLNLKMKTNSRCLSYRYRAPYSH